MQRAAQVPDVPENHLNHDVDVSSASPSTVSCVDRAQTALKTTNSLEKKSFQRGRVVSRMDRGSMWLYKKQRSPKNILNLSRLREDKGSRQTKQATTTTMLQSQSTLRRHLLRQELLRRASHEVLWRRNHRSFFRQPAPSSFSTSSTRIPYSTTAITQHSAAVALASTYDEDDEEYDEDVERFLLDSMGHLHHSALRPSRLTLELGENSSSWNANLWSVNAAEEEEEEEDEITEEEASEDRESSPQRNTAGAEETTSNIRRKSARELLAAFDPLNEPRISENGDRAKQLEELQLWLECSAQHDSIEKVESVIESARQRKDYTSLTTVQQQMIQWFDPMLEMIEKHQRKFLSGDSKKKWMPSETKFGPYICTLPASKLALITVHVTLMQTLLSSEKFGCPLVKVVSEIGQAVEDEVVIHRVLHKRFEEAKEERKRYKGKEDVGDGDNIESTASDLASMLASDDLDAVDVKASAIKDSDKVNITHKWSYAASHLNEYMEELSRSQTGHKKKRRRTALAVKRARKVLESDQEWPKLLKMQLGAALLNCLFETATVTAENGNEEPGFTLQKKWIGKGKVQGHVSMNDRFFEVIKSDKLESLAAITSRHKPMIVPPKPWTGPTNGGYLMLEVEIMRHRGCETQREALEIADNSIICDGLTALGRVPWKINQPILDVAWQCWHDDFPLGDIPTRTDIVTPDEPIAPAYPGKLEKGTPLYEQHMIEFRTFIEQRTRYHRALQKNMDLRSLRCSAELKLDQATQFQNFEAIYFPYNLDFRGRAYPVPPHLSTVGSDLCRGMLMFAEAKPLGERGFYWLKVHLANFAGKDKMTFDDRAKFVDDHMDQVLKSARDPFGGERWWMSLEDPFQGLATCNEIAKAIDSGDPASYKCSLPVHMDGSCNGLQHYAALGRDYAGGKAVNLCEFDEPQDVYIGVMHEVIRRVAEEAEREVDFDTSNVKKLTQKQKTELKMNRSAKLVNGIVDRGVVKRTVMTSVYGVTHVGARAQIQEKIEEKLESKGYDLDDIENEVFQASGYLATITMDVIGELFSGAKETMNWLTTCARLINEHGYPVAWISPIGVPAIQPYRLKKKAILVTLLQTLQINNESDALPIHKTRQASAFSPNFIHSLDSSHMLLTALEMDRRGLTFSAVHDSFWTHPCDVDEMNMALREVFVDLYSQPILERLKSTWEKRYPDLEFPDLPKRGDLDLEEVKRAKYFFQ